MTKAFFTGVNWLSPANHAVIRELTSQGHADFCEIMVDNFIHLSPENIRQTLPDVPFALHIVASRFLEKPIEELKILAQYLRPWIKALQPVYVSDHLVQFTHQGKRLPLLNELDYAHDYAHIKKRVCVWQELLDVPVLFENHASLTPRGHNQPEFFAGLMRNTGAGLLFDISNAYIAEHNQVCPMKNWDALAARAKHLHIAGFRLDKTSCLALDTHDNPLMDEVAALVGCYMKGELGKTLVIEFDAGAKASDWKKEIAKTRNAAQNAKERNCAARIDQSVSQNANERICAPRVDQSASVIAVIELQNLRHRLFRSAPRLLALSAKNGDDILYPFLDWLGDKQVQDWVTHFYLLQWLLSRPEWSALVDEDIAKELLTAAATRWSLQGFDHIDACGIVLAASGFPGLGVGIWKSRSADTAAKITVLRLPLALCPAQDSYSISYEYNRWDGLNWIAL